MAKLTTAKRKKIPKSQYGLPSKAKKGPLGGAPRGAYPMPDKAHAANAKSRAAQELKKGNISRSEYDTIVAKANKIMKKRGRK